MILFYEYLEEIAVVVAGALGGLFRYMAASDNSEPMHRAVIYVFCGCCCAYYFGPAFIDYMGWDQKYVALFGFFFGFAALSIAKALMNLLDKIEKSPEFFLKKWFGNGNSNK